MKYEQAKPLIEKLKVIAVLYHVTPAPVVGGSSKPTEDERKKK